MFSSTESELGENQDSQDHLPTKRLLRSGSEQTQVIPTPGRSHVLPIQCIICRETKYTREKASQKRKRERLVQCETNQGGQLVKAAKIRQDEQLLLQIQDRDLVAIEARYHKSCYLKYTKIVRLYSSNDQSETPQKDFEISFQKFSQAVLKEKIIEGKEIWRLTKLTKAFVKIVKEVEGIDAEGYKTHNLKNRIKKAHPIICFSRPSRFFESDIVFAGSLDVMDVVEEAVHESSTSESESTSSGDFTPEKTDNYPGEIRELYLAAQNLKNLMENSTTTGPWPPTAADLTIDKIHEIVPYQLFNFLAWSTGCSSVPISSGRIAVAEEDELRVLSIAQDIMYLKAKGRTLMPKHTALAMAVRHFTGSAKLIGLLNGLGHCVSNSVVLGHDTALAKRQLAMSDVLLPPGTQPIFSTLVWDNNDFGEETISGKGTTHNTNGIIIQRPTSSSVNQSPAEKYVPKSNARSFQPLPTEIKPYLGLKKKGPRPFGKDVLLGEENHLQAQENPRKLDLAYVLMKLAGVSEEFFAGWTGFNTTLNCSNVPWMSKVGYLPIIDASPTEYDTVFTILDRSVEIASSLDQEKIVVVFDQAIYAKAQQIRWRNDEFMNKVVIRLGAFHTAMSLLACIGKRFRDAGLEDIMIESGIVAQGSINGVMNGHHYNRSMRSHKCVMEALQRLRWQVFLNTLPDEEKDSVLGVLVILQSSFPSAAFQEHVQSERFADVLKSYSQFISTHSNDPTFAVWSSYIEMVELLLLFVRATREGNWDLHLSSIRSLLPWFFAYDRTNYSRYLPAYWLEMCELPVRHPLVHDAFMIGEFAVQRQQEHGFSQVACDQAIEQTCNRDTKTKGGMIGFTTRKGAVQRWILSQHERSAISKRCEEMAGQGEKTRRRKDLDKTWIKKDEEDVRSVISCIEARINPFEESNERLLHISSGVVASKEVNKDYLEARERGDASFVVFCKDRLHVSDVDMFATLKKQKLKTFSSMNKMTTSKVKGKEVTLKADRTLFQRLLIIASVRKLDIPKMLTYNLGPLPLSLATFNGCLNKTTKASLMHYIESIVDPSPVMDSVPKGSVWLVDGMAMLQELPQRSIPSTFGLLADHLLRQLVNLARGVHSDAVHFVVDMYPKISIKNAERGKRAASGSQVTKIYGEDQKVPHQWKKFLSCSDNKVALQNFLFEAWSKRPAKSLHKVTVFAAHGCHCHSLKDVAGEMVVENIADLECNHEEADTRLFLHAKYAALYQTSSNTTTAHVIVKSPDTDVFVIGVCKANRIGTTLLLHTGRGNNKRVLNLTNVHNYLGAEVSDALIGLHCFTGCDSVSAFYGKGKSKAIKLMMGDSDVQKVFKQIGSSFEVSEEVIKAIERFVCKLYDQDCSLVNMARYNMFLMVTKTEAAMPPTSDSLQQHIFRANYQAAIHTRCFEQVQDIPSPHGHGWKIVNDMDLDILWGDLPPAPDSVLELSNCRCKKTKCKAPLASLKGKCSCRQNNVPCTDLCTCIGCENSLSTENSDDEEIDSDEDC